MQPFVSAILGQVSGQNNRTAWSLNYSRSAKANLEPLPQTVVNEIIRSH